MILRDVSNTIHADSLALFALNIESLLADVTKPEKSKILTLTWPVTSSVTSGSNFWSCTDSSRTGLSNGVWNFEIGPVVWEISGGGLCPPHPQQGPVSPSEYIQFRLHIYALFEYHAIFGCTKLRTCISMPFKVLQHKYAVWWILCNFWLPIYFLASWLSKCMHLKVCTLF